MALSKKFVLYIILSSLLVFTCTTVLEIYHGYSAGKKKIEKNIEFVGQSYLKPVTLSLYNYDHKQLQLLLDAINTLEGISSSSIIEKNSQPPASPENLTSYSYDLIYNHPSGRDLSLGELVLHINYSVLKDEVLDWLPVRLLTLFLALCLLTILVTFLFRRFIGVPLGTIARFASSITISDSNDRLALDPLGRNDELSKVVNAINDLLSRLETGIMEQKQAQKALKHSEEAYRTLVEHANDSIFVLQDNRLLFCNSATETITGYSTEELSKLNILDLIHDEEKELIATRIQKKLAGELLSPITSFRILHKDGESRFGSLNSVLIKWDDKPALLGFLRDQTQQKNLEKQLNQAKKMDSIGRLAGGVAHDLNNLLTPILGYAELLQYMIEEPSKKQTNALTQILQAGKKARDLIQQLLAFSRKQTLEYKPININDIVSGMEPLLQRTVRENIQLQVKKGEDLPKIMGDISQLEQVVMNLAVNSSDAMPDGGLLLIETSIVQVDKLYAVSHQTVEPGTYLQLTVNDTGIGMNSETCQKIFEPFFTTKGNLGTGLGLATVYGIVKQHKGFTNVYSEPGKGTSFHIYLPVTEDECEGVNVPQKEPVEIRGDETILLVEDNEQVNRVTVDMLESLGYRVLSAENGEEAIALYQNEHKAIDLLLTDVIMPKMNGRELYETLCQQEKTLKVIYMSGYTSDVITHQGVLAEGTQFIQKPFSSNLLATKIRGVLNE